MAGLEPSTIFIGHTAIIAVYLHYFKWPQPIKLLKRCNLWRCAKCFMSPSRSISRTTPNFFQPVIWTDAFKGNFKSRQIFISPSDRTNIFQQFWIGPVVLEKTMKMWKVYRRMDRWTIDDRCSEVQHCCIASSKHILSEMKAKFKPLVRINPFTHYFFTQP